MKNFATVVLVLIVLPSFGQSMKALGEYTSTGFPRYLDNKIEEISPVLLEDINLLLPDGKNLQQNNPALYDRNTLSYITLNKGGDVYLSFISEGADFKSAVGFYTFKNNSPDRPFQLNTRVAYPNVSAEGSGGNLKRGQRVRLGNFEAGTKIGFFLAANAFRYGRVMASGRDIFFTESKYNPESEASLKKHSILLYDEQTDRYVLLFEDFNRERGSDHDFNDAIFVISTTETGALSTANAPEIQYEKDILLGNTNSDEPVEERLITICHYPPGNQDNPQEITIKESAWTAHKDHGDSQDGCPVVREEIEVEIEPKGLVSLSGTWLLRCKDAEVEISEMANGIRVSASNSKNWITYVKTGDNKYSDELGNSYHFQNDSTATWSGTREWSEFSLYRPTKGKPETKRITICHYPPGNKQNPQQITISENAWKAHEKHGDTMGGCEEIQNEPENEIPKGSRDVSGFWELNGRNQVNEVRIIEEGIEVRSRNSKKWFIYPRVGPNVFRDSKGNTYFFESETRGSWTSGNGKTVIIIEKR